MKFCAVILALWYLMSIIGFNVHICHSAHHAEEHHECCCHHEDGGHGLSFACCSDEYHVLTLPGLISSNENDLEDYADADLNLFAGYVSDVCIASYGFNIHNIRYLPDSGHIACGDSQSVLGIWRI